MEQGLSLVPGVLSSILPSLQGLLEVSFKAC